jgi:predicted HD superfamily hydrolase involved in NAD metabolism
LSTSSQKALTSSSPNTNFTETDIEGSDTIKFWLERVRGMVKPERFEHILRVAALSKDIAHSNGLHEFKAYLAGVLHDIARDLTGDELLRLAPPESEMDAAHPLAVHGRAGRVLLESYGFNDTEILDAVEDHTTAPREDKLLSMCLYVADVTEPGRGVNHHIRELAFQDLPKAFAEAVACKVSYLQKKGVPVHPRTLAAFDRLKLEGQIPDDLECGD